LTSTCVVFKYERPIHAWCEDPLERSCKNCFRKTWRVEVARHRGLPYDGCHKASALYRGVGQYMKSPLMSLRVLPLVHAASAVEVKCIQYAKTSR
jgi:hypothetical protein